MNTNFRVFSTLPFANNGRRHTRTQLGPGTMWKAKKVNRSFFCCSFAAYNRPDFYLCNSLRTRHFCAIDSCLWPFFSSRHHLFFGLHRRSRRNYLRFEQKLMADEREVCLLSRIKWYLLDVGLLLVSDQCVAAWHPNAVLFIVLQHNHFLPDHKPGWYLYDLGVFVSSQTEPSSDSAEKKKREENNEFISSLNGENNWRRTCGAVETNEKQIWLHRSFSNNIFFRPLMRYAWCNGCLVVHPSITMHFNVTYLHELLVSNRHVPSRLQPLNTMCTAATIDPVIDHQFHNSLFERKNPVHVAREEKRKQ